jgi:glycosyltransferase involved in cell wall biosynthesis
MERSIAVLIPCYNEEQTIEKVVQDFQRELPDARIFVYDNRSSDDTVARASRSGALIGFEPKKGKGNVVRTMFREIDADIYVMVDGDSTYPAHAVHNLLEPIFSGKSDMTVGTRIQSFDTAAFRRFHTFGNALVRRAINTFFGANLTDIMSGYRCFTNRFVKCVPILSKGFEVETEMTLQALDKNFIIEEIPIEYHKRPEGSYSKLNTVGDGILVLRTILLVFKDYYPLRFFGLLSFVCFLLGSGLGSIPVADFMGTRKVMHPSTAVLSATFMVISVLLFLAGLILDTINRRQKENYQLIADSIIFPGGRFTNRHPTTLSSKTRD